MTDTYEIAGDKFSINELPGLLDGLNVSALLYRRYIEYKCSKNETPTKDEIQRYQADFLRKRGIENQQDLKNWLKKNCINEKQIAQLMYKSLQLELYKVNKYADKTDSYFLEKKSELDRICYSLIRVKEKNQCHEIYVRLVEEESTFSELAAKYSIGREKNSNGFVGPVGLGKLSTELSERLKISKVGQLWPPFLVGNNWVLLRLEKKIPARLTNAMRKSIIDLLHEEWINKKVIETLQSTSGKYKVADKINSPNDADINISVNSFLPSQDQLYP